MNDGNFDGVVAEPEASKTHVPRKGREKAGTDQSTKVLQEVKVRVHRKLIDMLDLARLADVESEQLKTELRPTIIQLLDEESALLNGSERQRIITEILDEIFGFGPLESLLSDDTITDILVNGSKEVFVERRGKLERSDVTFIDDKHLLQVIDRIVSRVGRRIDEACPMVDARLPDGSRVNAVIPPLAIDGPAVAIRRFGVNPLCVEQLLNNGSITDEIVEFLKGAVQAGLNILVSGGTGSGKTTLLNILSGFIPQDERIITIEDSAELLLQQPHVVRLETRPPNIEGVGQIAQRDLLFNSLRMRPDRIIVGEVRGAEALDMLQAMNTGHDGSLTTIHANTPRDALSRIETMVSMTGFDFPVHVVRQQMASALDLVVQAARMFDGRRRVTSVSEVVGMEGEVITMQEIFSFQLQGQDLETGMAKGQFVSSGLRPRGLEKIRSHGVHVSDHLFERRAHVIRTEEAPSEEQNEPQHTGHGSVPAPTALETPLAGRTAPLKRGLGSLSNLRDHLRKAS